MAWRVANSLLVLRRQIDAEAPHRSRASDGTIGDPAHASRCSRHNPNDDDVVTAMDITHDPDRGCDIHAIADHIRRHPHSELSYMISRGRIAGRSTGWAWHRYTGSNPHNVHVHFGVGNGTDCNPIEPYDSRQLWSLPQEDPFMALTDDEQRELLTNSRQAKADAAAARFLAQLTWDLMVPNGFVRVNPHTGEPVGPGTPGAKPAFDVWRWTRESVEADRLDADRHAEMVVRLDDLMDELIEWQAAVDAAEETPTPPVS